MLSIFKNAGFTTDLTFGQLLLTVAMAALLGLMIAAVYKYTNSSMEYTQEFAVTLVMMSVIIAIVVAAIGGNVASAFSFAGVLSIIRFRTVMGSPRDVAFVLFSVSAGLCVGVGAYLYAAVASVALFVLVILMYVFNLFAPRGSAKRLKITIPENMNYEGIFEEIIDRYCTRHRLVKVENADLGTLFELVYEIEVKKGADEKAFLDEIRCKNGNLSISLVLAGYHN